MSLIGPKTKPQNSWESHSIGCKIIKWVSISYNRTPSCDSVSWVTMTTSHHCASAILYRTRGKWLDKILVNFWIYTRMRSLLTSKLRIRRKPKRWHSHPSQVVDNPSHKHTCIVYVDHRYYKWIYIYIYIYLYRCVDEWIINVLSLSFHLFYI